MASSDSTAAAIKSVAATSADAFVNSVGVDTHIDSGEAEWLDESLVASELSYLGVHNVRDGTPYSWALPAYVALAKTGVEFDLTQENPVAAALTTIGALQDVERADALQLAVPGSVKTLEGANEYNVNSYDLGLLNSYGDVAWGALDDKNLLQAVQADSRLAGVGVVAASTSGVAVLPNVTADVTASNFHVYAAAGQQLAANMAAGVAAAKASAPGKPVYITEAGVSSSGYASSTYAVADAVTQGLIDVNALLDGYSDGAAKTFLYDLMDDTGKGDKEDDFGLFTTTGAPKPAAVDVSDLLKILSTGAGSGPLATGSLSYGIAGLPSTASSMLLEKADGAFDIVLWNGGATLYNGAGDVKPPTSEVTITLGAASEEVTVYDPVKGASALQTLPGAASVTVGLSADPIVIEVTPAAAPGGKTAAAPAKVTLGSGPDTLALQVSGDAWDGDATFTIAVDGVQIGGVQTALASHAAGQSQTFDVDGAFAPGAHTVSVDFLNDAFGGSASTDRNLYVTGSSIDGAAVSGGALTEMSGGSQSFGFTQPTSTMTLNLSEDAWKGDAEALVTVDGKQAGGTLTVTASHAAGKTQTFTLAGSWGPGPHTVGVQFINDAYGGSASADRNLYVDGVSYDGQASSTPAAALLSNGTAYFAVKASTLVLQLSEDAYQGDALFSVAVDGKTLGSPQAVTALHSAGALQDFAFDPVLSTGAHDVAITFLNDDYGGTSAMDRNLYVGGIEVNGAAAPGASAALMSNGAVHFTVTA